MDEIELQFNADNYCPGEIFKEGLTFKTCGVKGNYENACLKCWQEATSKK